MSQSKLARSWSDLPTDLLRMISRNLKAVPDYVRFRSVCNPWRSAARPLDLPPQLPLLTFYAPGDDTTSRDFISLSEDNKLYRIPLPEARGKKFVGTNHGWLLVFDTHNAFLLNPLTRFQLPLPLLSTLAVYGSSDDDDDDDDEEEEEEIEEPYVFHAVLSSDPSTTTYVVLMVIHGEDRELAFCWPGAASWIKVKAGGSFGFTALGFCKGKFFAANDIGSVFVCNDAVTPAKATAISSLRSYRFDRCYMVESEEELFVILKYRKMRGSEEKEVFKVLRLDFVEGEAEWSRIRSIGDRAFFLSEQNCLSVSVTDFPACNPNCIYYAAGVYNASYGICMGLSEFDLREKTTTRIIPCYPASSAPWFEPAWLPPSLY